MQTILKPNNYVFKHLHGRLSTYVSLFCPTKYIFPNKYRPQNNSIFLIIVSVFRFPWNQWNHCYKDARGLSYHEFFVV